MGNEAKAQERKAAVREAVRFFSERAAKHDLENSFPVENMNDLKRMGYHAFTVPERFGGQGITLTELLRLQEIIALEDGATALSIGWHMGLIKQLDETNAWADERFAELCEQVVESGALINAAATEAGTGSPTRGGKPETTAEKQGNKWVVSGRKTFTTMAPVLDFFIVSASIKGSERVANFLIAKNTPGLSIVETWNTLGMRATGSHDLLLNEVRLDENCFVERLTQGPKPAAGWLLHIPACYLGIARAAFDYAVSFAKEYSPNSIEGPIAKLPSVQMKIGEAALLLEQSRSFLYAVSNEWDGSIPEVKSAMKSRLGAVKLTVTNQAIQIVDLAMRIVGAQSLNNDAPLQRYYRDVRAGLHNPPMDDMTIRLLAQEALEKE